MKSQYLELLKTTTVLGIYANNRRSNSNSSTKPNNTNSRNPSRYPTPLEKDEGDEPEAETKGKYVVDFKASEHPIFTLVSR